MSQQYSDPTREEDPHALPDVEVFYRTSTVIAIDDWRNGEGDLLGAGWYFWSCFPGCMPDSDPEGPYATEQDAINAAQEGE